MDYNMLGNRMQNSDQLTSMKINRGNRSFARSRGTAKQHHHNNGIFVTTILSCKPSVTFALCCLYLLSCCWIQPIVASSSQKAHDFMSVDDLRKIFQVEHHNDVPHYEVVKIHSVRHTVSKRSITSNPYNAKDTLNSNYNRRRSSDAAQDRRESDYDGKHEFSPYNVNHGSENSSSSPSSDLGITDVRWTPIHGAVYPYTTKTLSSSSLPSSGPSPQISRTSSSQSSPITLNSSSSSSFSENLTDSGNTESVDDREPEVDHIHRVNINTHGRKLNLELSPIQHLLSKRSALENTWFADGYPNNVSYTPSPKDTEDIGDVYQDVRNQAAILVYRDKHDGAVLMDGTIGDDLVVKPLPAALRSKLQQHRADELSLTDEIDTDFDYMDTDGSSDSLLVSSFNDHRRTNENDDYAFLDEDLLKNENDEDVKESLQRNYRRKSEDGRQYYHSQTESSFRNGDSNRQSRRKNIGPNSWRRRGKRSAMDTSEAQGQDEQNKEINPSMINSEFHIVYKRKDTSDEHTSDYNFMEADKFPLNELKDKNEKRRRQKRGVFEDEDSDEDFSHSRRKRQAPYLIFPEILCIIDYDGYRLHGKDNIAIKRYVISFWNGIDLRYKLLKGPAVKISIAGIIISRGRDATPYLERNRVGRDAIDSASALTDMGKYLFLERRLPVYDIAVAITKLDMCRRKTRNGECNRGTAGFAYVGGACVVNKRLEKVNSVAIVEDTGGFSGIIVAAHELGHLLGAVHDGSPPPSYLGGPGARKCRWEDGFIMSDLRHTSKGFRWSHCTVKQFRHFLNGETATCMYNSPHETESLPRVLPGKLLTLDAQCRKDRGTSACFKDDRVCSQLFCFDAGSGYCVSYRPAAEGSRCGDSQMCLNGKCVFEHENEVDYDGYSFLRRSGIANEDKMIETPSEKRKWWNRKAEKLELSKTQKTKNLNNKKTKKDVSETSTTTSTTSKPSDSTTTTTLAPSTTTNNPTTSTTTMNYFKFFATSSTTTFSILKTSTVSALPWWKRISRKSPAKFLIQKSPSSKSSSTTVPTTTTRKTTTTYPTTTLRSFARSPTTPLTTSTTTRSRKKDSHIPKSGTFVKPFNTPKSSLVKKSRTRSQLRSLISGHSRRNRKGDTRSSTSEQDGTTTVNRARDGKEVGNLGGSQPVTKDRKNKGGRHGIDKDEETNTVEGQDSKKCEDRISNIAGSMSCKTFLRSFAYQYCKHKYIKKNCCASHKIYCLKTGRSRTTRRGRTLIFRAPNSNVTTSINSTSTTDKVFKRNAKYTSNIRSKLNDRFRQNSENKTHINPFVSRKNSTSTLINRIHLSALPSVFQQQQSRYRTNRSRFYRSIEQRRS